MSLIVLKVSSGTEVIWWPYNHFVLSVQTRVSNEALNI